MSPDNDLNRSVSCKEGGGFKMTDLKFEWPIQQRSVRFSLITTRTGKDQSVCADSVAFGLDIGLASFLSKACPFGPAR